MFPNKNCFSFLKRKSISAVGLPSVNFLHLNNFTQNSSVYWSKASFTFFNFKEREALEMIILSKIDRKLKLAYLSFHHSVMFSMWPGRATYSDILTTKWQDLEYKKRAVFVSLFLFLDNSISFSFHVSSGGF